MMDAWAMARDHSGEEQNVLGAWRREEALELSGLLAVELGHDFDGHLRVM